MAGPAPSALLGGNDGHGAAARPATQDPRWARYLLIAIAVGFLGVVVVVPVVLVFANALREGLGAYGEAVTNGHTGDAIALTLLVAVTVVPIHIVLGVAAAWLVTKYEFRGKRILVTLIELPFSVSPVIAGMTFVLLFGPEGPLAGTRVLFAVPGIILATLFVTFPFVAREVITVMQAQGNDEEIAALTLGASGWQTFWHVTLPKIRWGLLYGVVICTARAVGEFGAVSVVSGGVRGETSTMPLHIEDLENEYSHVAAFSVATLLIGFAMTAIVLKGLLAWRVRRQLAAGARATLEAEQAT